MCGADSRRSQSGWIGHSSIAARGEKAVAANPGKASAHTNLGGALAQSGRLDAAIAQFEQVVALQPAHTQLALRLAMAGKASEGVPHLDTSFRLSPSSIETRVLLGRLLASQSKLQAAIPHFDAAFPTAATPQPSISWAAAMPKPGACRRRAHALSIAEGQGNRELAEALRARLAAYRSASPSH